jgi:amino acid adenylation domain-containing protein
MPFLLHDLLRESARRAPDAVAVSHAGRTLGYADLDVASDRLAAFLGDRGVRRGDRVGLYLGKSLESIVALFGILKLGAAYVPVDPNAPPRRAAYILQNCSVRALITSRRLLEAMVASQPDGWSLAVILLADGDSHGTALGAPVRPLAELESGADPSFSPVPAIDTDLAYILYTSGSTGEPKGVMLSHRHALTFVDWAHAEVGVTSDDRLSNHAPLHFDLSVFDIFVAVKAGATVVLVPDGLSTYPVRLAELIETEAITVWYSVPSALTLLVTRGGLDRRRLERLRTILFAGEVFPMKFLRLLRAAVPHAALANLYGPTETNVCTYFVVPADLDTIPGTLPIGRACANTEVFAVTPDGQRAKVDEEGELLVRGSTLMTGYWGHPDLTARVLRQNPLHDDFHDPVYATGDVVRLDADGNYHFLGRRDNVIKSRGYRIELGEIEATLYRHHHVGEAAVLAMADEEIGNRLIGFVAPAAAEISEPLLKQHCATYLPRYMVPERFILEPALPKTSTGKIDRQRLRARLLGAAPPA